MHSRGKTTADRTLCACSVHCIGIHCIGIHCTGIHCIGINCVLALHVETQRVPDHVQPSLLQGAWNMATHPAVVQGAWAHGNTGMQQVKGMHGVPSALPSGESLPVAAFMASGSDETMKCLAPRDLASASLRGEVEMTVTSQPNAAANCTSVQQSHRRA